MCNGLPLQMISLMALDLEACNENRTFKQIVTEAYAREFFFAGYLGDNSDDNFGRWGCFRRHPCLAAVCAPADDAMCYKYKNADGTWYAWDIASKLGLTCPV